MARFFTVLIVCPVLLLGACEEPDDILVRGECLVDEQCQGKYKNKTSRCNDQFACETLSCTSHQECWTAAQDETYYCDDSGATAVCTPFKCENDGNCVERFGSTDFFCNSSSKTCEIVSANPAETPETEAKVL